MIEIIRTYDNREFIREINILIEMMKKLIEHRSKGIGRKIGEKRSNRCII